MSDWPFYLILNSQYCSIQLLINSQCLHFMIIYICSLHGQMVYNDYISIPGLLKISWIIKHFIFYYHCFFYVYSKFPPQIPFISAKYQSAIPPFILETSVLELFIFCFKSGWVVFQIWNTAVILRPPLPTLPQSKQGIEPLFLDSMASSFLNSPILLERAHSPVVTKKMCMWHKSLNLC